jgi:ABC-2 type transport system permease protein
MSIAVIHRYTPFIRNSFLAMLAYRLRYVTGILTYTVFVSVYYFIWEAVYKTKGTGSVINGFSLQEMITYIAVGWISRSLYFSDIDEEIDELVRTGQIGIYLLRPVDFQIMMLAQAFGATLFRAACFAIPLGAVIVSIFPVSPPASVADFLLYLLSTFLGFLVFAEFNFIVGLLSFSLKSIQGVVRAKYYVVQFLSGLLLPLTFFPPVVEEVSKYLPFRAIAYTPLQTYLGKLEGRELWFALGVQVLWILVLFILGRLWWDKARSRLLLQGG